MAARTSASGLNAALSHTNLHAADSARATSSSTKRSRTLFRSDSPLASAHCCKFRSSLPLKRSSEQPVVGIVVFSDVDLMPEELRVDVSSQKLPPSARLGTVGLWVGLHGESFLDAGMHHLEARFDYRLLREQLKDEGVNTMNPFSDFEFLRQAFTEGERWPVSRG